jgi:hypothetical protein
VKWESWRKCNTLGGSCDPFLLQNTLNSVDEYVLLIGTILMFTYLSFFKHMHYHVCKLKTVYTTGMSYANNLAQRVMDWLIDW